MFLAVYFSLSPFAGPIVLLGLQSDGWRLVQYSGSDSRCWSGVGLAPSVFGIWRYDIFPCEGRNIGNIAVNAQRISTFDSQSCEDKGISRCLRCY